MEARHDFTLTSEEQKILERLHKGQRIGFTLFLSPHNEACMSLVRRGYARQIGANAEAEFALTDEGKAVRW